MFSSHLQGPGRSRFAPLNARCARHGPEDVPGSVPASTGPPKWAPGAPRGAQGLPKSTRKSSKIHGQSAPAPLGVPRVPRGWVPPPKSDPNGAEFDQKTPLGGKGPRTNIRKFAGIPSCFCTTAERVRDTLDCSGDARRHHTNGTSEKNWPPMRDGPAAHLPVFARTSQLPVRFSMIS